MIIVCGGGGYKLVFPQTIPLLDIDYICILDAKEWDIRERIYRENLSDLSKIISFHEICMMDSYRMSLNDCYHKMMQNVHPLQQRSASRWLTYEYLRRNYTYVLCDDKYWEDVKIYRKHHFDENIKPVWILWLQGFDKAPELVKVCVSSVKKALDKNEYICLLDENNLFNYIDLPDYVIEKWNKGIIDNTHFSDLIRLRLLNVYGGIWIDATVYLTGHRLPDYIKSNQLFMFSIWRNWRERREPIISASWLISAYPSNKILLALEALLNEYWKKENKRIHYLIFHIFLTIAAERFPNEWDQVETIPRDSARLLATELMGKFDSVRFGHLKHMSDIHKLSYKLPYAKAEQDSFWAKLYEIEEKCVEI